MEQYIPDVYQQSIYTINYKKLKERGIRNLLFDLDNTLVPVNIKEPNEKIQELFHDLKKQGFNIVIFSNSPKCRLKPFKDILEVDCCPSACKPRPNKFLTVMNSIQGSVSETAIIGDQMLTDIKGGNRVGITTVLINPISNKDHIFTKFNRFYEKKIMKKLRDKNLFVKGRYYD